MLFSQRYTLAKQFEKWAEENDIKICTLTVIGYLSQNNMLKEQENHEIKWRTILYQNVINVIKIQSIVYLQDNV